MAEVLLHVDFIETARGGRHLVWNGITFRQNNKTETFLSWISWNLLNEIAKPQFVPEKIGQPHNHLPDRAEVEERRILSTIRKRAGTNSHHCLPFMTRR